MQGVPLFQFQIENSEFEIATGPAHLRELEIFTGGGLIEGRVF